MEKHSKKILLGILIFFIAVITFSVGYLTRDLDILPPAFSKDDDGVLASDRAFFEVLNQLMDNHISQPTREELMMGAIDGMIDSLDDPYTSYFDLEEAEAFNSNFGETYVGIGVTVRYEQNLIIIEDVHKDGPAELSGIKVNDVITHVDGVEVFELSFYDTLALIVGDEGTEVVIGVYRAGFTETLHFNITRQVISNASVTYELIEEDGMKIGYIQVDTFGDQTFTLFNDAVTDLESQGMESLIVDLRDNGGGHLTTVYFMMNLFLVDDGDPIFKTEYYSNGVHYFKNYAASNTERKDYNIVTLINGNSASASEVFASGMKEHGNYTLVGETSFGKGTMQTDKLISATIGDQLHITIGKWTTADDGWVHYDGGTEGITPDIEVIPNIYEQAYKVFLLGGNSIKYDTVDVRTGNVQVILNLMGYDVRTDGYYDSLTRDAVIDIQQKNLLTQTGDLDEDTLEVINNFLDDYLTNMDNDSQLQAAIDYLLDNPDDPNG